MYRLASRMPKWKKVLAKKYSKRMTRPERLLWNCLKNKQLGVWIYKQKPALGFIVDFWCPCGVVIEVDGPCHWMRKDTDERRDAIFARKGIRTLRFDVGAVEGNIAAVVAVIRGALQKRQDVVARNKTLG